MKHMKHISVIMALTVLTSCGAIKDAWNAMTGDVEEVVQKDYEGIRYIPSDKRA